MSKMYSNPFQIENNFNIRKAEADRILSKYPDRIPIIVYNSTNSNIPEIDKHKYLIPKDLTSGQFLYVIRKRIKITPEQALFIFINNTMPASSALLSQIYKEHKSDDNFLYLSISGENTFG